MTDWLVQYGSDVKTVDEAGLRRLLRKGDLSGVELARPSTEPEWRPLHDWPVFREEVPVLGAPSAAARQRVQQKFLWHLAVFVAVVGGLTLSNGEFPLWGLFWAVAIAGHARRAWPALTAGRTASPEPVASTSAAGAPVQAATAAAPIEEAVPGLEAALEALEQTSQDPNGTAPDVAAIRRAATDLHDRRSALTRLCDPVEMQRLQGDLVQARARAASAPDARTSEAFESEARAIQERLDSMSDAASAAARLEARERALLHQVEALRLAAARVRADQEGPGPGVAEQAARLTHELRAASEVEEHLARARRARERNRSGA
jgi:hypothetical protein